MVLRLQSVMMADVSWCRGRTGTGYLKEWVVSRFLSVGVTYTLVRFFVVFSLDCCSAIHDELPAVLSSPKRVLL